MSYFLQQLINGLTLGAIYGLIAIGYTMVYGIIGMINFAHGEVYMIGAFISLITFYVLGALGVSYVPLALLIVLLCAMGFTAVYGWTIERIAYRPLRGSFRLAPLISAIGMSIFLQNYVQLLAGRAGQDPAAGGDRRISPDGKRRLRRPGEHAPDHHHRADRGADGRVQLHDRGDALGPRAARLRAGHDHGGAAGHRRRPHHLLTFVLGAALAAVAGLMVTLYYGVIDFFIGFLAGIKAFTAAVLGGIGSLPGAMLGGLHHRPDRGVLVGLFPVRVQGRGGVRGLDPGADLPADRIARQARDREGVMATAAAASGWIGRVRQAALAGLVAFALALPLAGIETTGAETGPGFVTRFDWVAIAVAAVFFGKLLLDFLPRQLLPQQRAARSVAASESRTILLIRLGRGGGGIGAAADAVLVALPGRPRHLGADLHHARLGLERGGGIGRAFRSRLRRVLRRRRLFLRAVRAGLRSFLLGGAADRRRARGRGRHPAGISGAAAARRLSRHRHAGFRRDRPHHADQLGQRHRRPQRHQRHSAAVLLRHAFRSHRAARRDDLQPILRHRFRPGAAGVSSSIT